MPENYASAGVNVQAGRDTVERIRADVKSTQGPQVLSAIGGFAGLYHLSGFKDPVLVAGADGVGTKVEVARHAGRLDTIGIDCVAMCVNDVLCLGAVPLFFLDYLAVDSLVPEDAAAIVAGVAEGCRRAGCSLIGGETAEMPGVYAPGRFDVAGFCVGAVERDRIVDPRAAEPGMAVIGLSSNGVHSNGYSLVRRLFPELEAGPDVTQSGLSGSHGHPPGSAVAPTGSHQGPEGSHGALTGPEPAAATRSLFDLFLKPTEIYVAPVHEMLRTVPVFGMAHITGGGWYENLPRMLAPGCAVEMDTGALSVPSVFDRICKRGVTTEEMYRTFNMGLGFALVVRKEDAAAAMAAFDRWRKSRKPGAPGSEMSAAVVGRIIQGNGEVTLL